MPSPPFIPLLEPIAGAGLAVSLAYLALDRFRYRDSVERYAINKHQNLLAEGQGEEDTVEVVKDLQWLCRKDCNGHIPRGFGASFYHYFFRNKLDEFLIAFLGLVAGAALVSGVAINLGRWWIITMIDSQWLSGLLFYGCVAALGVPAIAVLCGRRSVAWGHRFANHCEGEIGKIHKQSAKAASVPSLTPEQKEMVRRLAAARSRRD